MDPMTLWPFALTGITTIIWAVRLEGRINVQDALYKTQLSSEATLRQERQQTIDERHTEMQARLSRIEGKLDSLPARLNGGGAH